MRGRSEQPCWQLKNNQQRCEPRSPIPEAKPWTLRGGPPKEMRTTYRPPHIAGEGCLKLGVTWFMVTGVVAAGNGMGIAVGAMAAALAAGAIPRYRGLV